MATKKKAAPKKEAAQKSTPKKSVAKKAAPKKIEAKDDAAEGLKALMLDSLKDIYWAEKALLKAIPKMSKNATSDNLKKGLDNHLKETKGQIDRLEKVFTKLGEKAKAVKCEAMAGLIKESEEIMKETKVGKVRDAGIIAAAQKVEHYEIASYGTLCAFAKALGHKEVAQILHKTLEEEKAADQTLTDAAYNNINVSAIAK